MKKGELDFFKATVLSKSDEAVFMCSDMPMEDMAKDIDFGKKWMFAIAMTLKKGLHLNIIHNVDRHFKEMMLGLESWIPIYMTGQISPYYLKDVSNNIYCHLNYVSGNVCLSGECINGFHDKGKYHLSKNKDDVSYYKEKAKYLINKSQSLMEIYTKDSINVYNAFIDSNIKTNGNRRRILSSLPIFTIPEKILTEILKRNKVSNSDKDKILKFISHEKELIKNLTSNNFLLDEITQISKKEFEKYPIFLSLSGIFYEKKLYYTYEKYLDHLNSTKEYSDANSNYNVQINSKNIFRNIQILIHEGNFVIISKDTDPAIHFVIHHPKLCNAIENFIAPIED